MVTKEEGVLWFRFYNDAVYDPKVQMLPARLFKTWVNILCLASKQDGIIPHTAYIGRALGIKTATIRRQISRLTDVGLLDDVDGFLVPHNWKCRQYQSDSSTDRVRKHRYRNVSVTPPDTDTDTDTESDTDKKPHTPLKRGREYDSEFEEFWKAYPRKIGKGQAFKAFGAARKRASLDEIMAGLLAFCMVISGTEMKFIPHPTTWLNGDRWHDETKAIAPESAGRSATIESFRAAVEGVRARGVGAGQGGNPASQPGADRGGPVPAQAALPRAKA